MVPLPHALIIEEIGDAVNRFRQAAQRALQAGVEVAEIHAAHEYLLYEFLSSLSNQRDDAYGGSLAKRMRLLLEVVDATREIWPEHLPLLVRLSATDWIEGGATIHETVEVARALKVYGVDLVALARELLRNPHWPLAAARELKQEIAWAPQHVRAKLPL